MEELLNMVTNNGLGVVCVIYVLYSNHTNMLKMNEVLIKMNETLDKMNTRLLFIEEKLKIGKE